LFTAPAAAQVHVDAYLEKGRYLAGEPIVVVVDVLNVGDEPVGYSASDGNVRLAVAGVQRRVPPNIFGCSSGGFVEGGVAGGVRPLLEPGQKTSFTYLLKEYDLGPGVYTLSASGRAGVRWKYYPSYIPNEPPAVPPKHQATDPVPGSQFEHTLSLNIVAATEEALKLAFAPLVTDADAADPTRRRHARDAIIESAPPFLESLIARFAAEVGFNRSAIEALGRLGTLASRAQLKNLYRATRDSATVLALARVGHHDDAEFLAGVLQDHGDERSRRYAALGLGHIGGDQAVQYLEIALRTAPPEARPDIATALGNTRSPLAVPVLIGMFGNNPARSEVCGALTTLTHRSWCDGTAADPAAQRRQWLRSWNENGSSTPIFGPDDCPSKPVAPAGVVLTPPMPKRPSGPAVPTISSIQPVVAAPNSIVVISGYGLGLEDRTSLRVLFTQGTLEHVAAIGSSGRALSREPDGGVQYFEVVVPHTLAPGRWQLVVDANGRRSVPAALDIAEIPEVVLTGISPERPHPAQVVLLATTMTPAQIGEQVELTDARGAQWRIPTGVSALGISFKLPDDVADGEATRSSAPRVSR
jgi:hypothetical protein